MKRTLMNGKKIWISFLLLLAPLSFNGCDDSVSPSDFNLFSASDDIQLGQQLDAEITANPNEYPILNDQQATAYLQDIVNTITNSPEIKYKGTFAYQVKIINTSTVNAFAAPGGYLYVYKGLIKFLDNEATMAAVLAHEVAHAERRHATRRMTKQYGASIILGLILGNNPSVLEEIAANLLTGLAFLKNSRDDEYEADEYSFKYLQSTNWYPGATKLFFEKIGENQSGNKLEELLSTHPLPQERIKKIDNLIERNSVPPPTEANLFTTRYTNFKNSVPN